MWRLVLYSCLIVLWTLWEVGEAPAEQGNAMRAHCHSSVQHVQQGLRLRVLY